MAEWWANDPIVPAQAAGAAPSDKWWEAAPLAQQQSEEGRWWEASPLVESEEGKALLRPAEQPGMVSSAVRGAAQGLTLGAGDEGSAAAAASPIPGAEQRARILPLPDPIDLLSGGARMLLEKVAPGTFGASGGAAYDRGLESRRADDRAAKEANPISFGAGEIAGGVVPVVAAASAAPTAFGLRGGLAARSALSAASGAGVGTLQGFNSGEGGLSARVDNAGMSAIGGGVVGAFAPGVGAGVGNAVRRIGDALVNRTATMPGYTSRAVQVVADALEAQRAVNPTLEADVARFGPNAMLLDAGDALKGLAQGVSVRPGEARSRIVQALTERKTGTNARIGSDLDASLGRAVVPSEVEAGLAQGRQAVGDAYGEVFRNARAVDTTTLANQLDTMAVGLRGDPRRAVLQARDMLNIPGQRVLDPSPRALFNTRQALDGLMESEKDSKVLSQLGFVRQAVDDYLGQAVPGLKQVDARFQELARQSEGLKAGSSVLDSGKTAIRPAEMADAVTAGALPDGMMIGPSGETFRMRQGVRGEIDRLVGTKSNDYLAVRDAVKGEGDWNRAKLTQLFGEERASQVVNAVDREAAFEKVYRDVVENSQTKMRDAAEKLVAIRDGKPGEGAGVTALVGTVGGPGAVAGQAALKGGKAVKSVMDVAADQARNNDVARMLLLPANEISPVMDVLARNSRGRAAAETGSKATERIVQALLQSRGYDTGRLGAPYAQRLARSALR